jgi:hypothetical protein
MNEKWLILKIIQKYNNDEGYRELSFFELWNKCEGEELEDRILYWDGSNLLFKLLKKQGWGKYCNSKEEIFCINTRYYKFLSKENLDYDEIGIKYTPIINKILNDNFDNIAYFYG